MQYWIPNIDKYLDSDQINSFHPKLICMLILELATFDVDGETLITRHYIILAFNSSIDYQYRVLFFGKWPMIYTFIIENYN